MDLKGYVSVADRLAAALQRWPELRVQETARDVVQLDGATYLAIQVTVYRTPEDTLPTVAWAWEPWPGRTPYTKGAEYMVGATSALGRALGYMGCGSTVSIASSDEVAARIESLDSLNLPVTKSTPATRKTAATSTQPQLTKISAMLDQLGHKGRDAKLAQVALLVGRTVASSAELTGAEASMLIGRLEDQLQAGAE